MRFTTIKLSNGLLVEVEEITGLQIFQAAFSAGKQSENKMVFTLHLIAVSSRVNGKQMSIEQVKALPFCDLNLIAECVNSQMVKVPK